MAVRRFTVVAAVDASGDATVYSPFLSGFIESVQYVKTDYADGVDFTITTETTVQTIWTESNVNAAAVKAPRQATHTPAGVAIIHYGAGNSVADKIAVGRERIKIVVAQGGVSKTGTFQITVSD
jgi:hypothetical protein